MSCQSEFPVNKDLLQQIETKYNTLMKLSKDWDSMLKTASCVTFNI